MVVLFRLLNSLDCLPLTLSERALRKLAECSIYHPFHDRVLHLVLEVRRLEDFWPYFIFFDFLEYDAIDEVSCEFIDFEVFLRRKHRLLVCLVIDQQLLHLLFL